MKTVKELLESADPLLYESTTPSPDRDLRRQTILAATNESRATDAVWKRGIPILTGVALVVIVGVIVASHIWTHGTVNLQAAVRFEVRLAEDTPAAGLREAKVLGSDRVVYLHPDVIVTNSDIAQARVVPGDSPSRFGVGVEFNAAGAQKMRTATASHLGKPLAVLIDGDVVMAPTLRSPIDALAEINGDLTRAEVERIVNGIGIP